MRRQREREEDYFPEYFIRTFVETELLFDLSTLHVPHHSSLRERERGREMNCVYMNSVSTLSTPPVTIHEPFGFHLRAKMGPEWWTSVDLSVPSLVHTRATPS